MPYSSSLFTFLGEQLRQPTWWAAIASVGIHGMLGVSTPVMSVFYPRPKPPGKVEVVQLTAAEMSRLPQTLPTQISPPKFSISPIPAPPNVIPPLPPGPSDLQFPSLPPGMSSFLPPRSSLPPLNSPPPSNDVPFTPPRNKPLLIDPPPLQPQPTPSIPPPLQGDTLPNVPQVRNDQATESDLDKYRNTEGRRPQFEPPKIYTPEDFPQGGTTRTPNKTAVNPDPRQISPTGENPGGNPGTTAPTPSVQDTTKRNRLAESPLVTAMRQKMEAERQARQTPNAGTQGGSTSASTEQDMAFANTYSSLFVRFQQAYPTLEMTKYVLVPLDYPKEACSQKLEDKVIYGVVVKPEGAIAAAPELLATRGYSILDLAAKNAIGTYTFPATSAPKLYALAFEFKYDEKTCGSQPVAPSPSPQPSPTPQPLKSSPTPQPPKSSPTPQPPKSSPTPQPPKSSPTPQPQPSAPPSPTPTPEAPTPTPETSPTPTPETSPAPTPESSTQPTPETSPMPTPETSPTPTPENSPMPTPETSPMPTPETSPTPTPETNRHLQ